MMRLLFAVLSGSVFGLGLFISGMTDTTKIQGWLDIFGDWDPTLAFVLGGGVIPMMFAWRIAQRQKTSFLGSPIPIPTDPVIDQRLIIGSALFGIGWALSGLCPGPRNGLDFFWRHNGHSIYGRHGRWYGFAGHNGPQDQ